MGTRWVNSRQEPFVGASTRHLGATESAARGVRGSSSPAFDCVQHRFLGAADFFTKCADPNTDMIVGNSYVISVFLTV